MIEGNDRGTRTQDGLGGQYIIGGNDEIDPNDTVVNTTGHQGSLGASNILWAEELNESTRNNNAHAS